MFSFVLKFLVGVLLAGSGLCQPSTFESSPRVLNYPVNVDGERDIFSVRETDHIATAVGHFCAKHQGLGVDDCFSIYRKMVEEVFALPMSKAKSVASPPTGIDAFISSPLTTRYYPVNQRLYFEFQVISNFTSPHHFCLIFGTFEANKEGSWCGTLPATEPIYTQPNQLPVGRHLVHLARGGKLEHSLFFEVTEPSISIELVQVFHPDKMNMVVKGRFKVTLSGGFLPGVDGPLCFEIDRDIECFHTNQTVHDYATSARPDIFNRTTGLPSLANLGSDITISLFKDIAMVDGDRQISLGKDIRRHCVVAIAKSFFYDAKAVAISNELCFLTEHPQLILGQKVEYMEKGGGMIHLNVGSGIDATAGESPLLWLRNLGQHEWGIYSQNGEDGVLLSLLRHLKIGHFIEQESRFQTGNRQYVEFGTEDGSECNTRILRERFGWSGLLMDGGNENTEIGLYKEFITADNINTLFGKYSVPIPEFDLLVIDLDFNDFYVWENIDHRKYRPRIVIIEYNGNIPVTEARTVKRADSYVWTDGTSYTGASLAALAKLARRLGYTLVYAESHGVNAFFVRDDVLQNCLSTLGTVEKNELDEMLKIENLFRRANYFGRGWWYRDMDPNTMLRDGKEWIWV